jgi:nitrilase
MKTGQIRVAGLQIAQVEGNRQANIEAAIGMIESVEPHDIYVLPELSSSGYSPRVFQALDELAEELEGSSYDAFSEIARKKGCCICYSFPRRVERNQFTICTAVVDSRGELAAFYDKWHVCSTGDCCEKDYFTAGRGPLGTFEVKGAKVGLAICYDIRFPEMIRKLALEQDIVLVLHPGGWPKDECFFSWHTFVQTRAMENQIYIMSTNWAGLDNGRSVFCPPFVDGRSRTIETLDDSPGVLSGVVDLRYLQDVREKYPYRSDRSEFY